MSGLLEIRAGATAFRKIKENGLAPNDIAYVFGASGAAKWLAIYGLDRAIFGEWFKKLEKPVHLFGTSVGAFKLAAACHTDPASALENLANAYVEQSYTDKDFSANRIASETKKILATVASPTTSHDVLENPLLHFHCGAIRTRGALAKDQSIKQKLSLAKIFFHAFGDRTRYGKSLERMIFHHPQHPDTFSGADGVTTLKTSLSKSNLRDALLASGSIPGLMNGVANISGAPDGQYYDGGVLDYHPVPKYLGAKNGLTLYPHFYPHLIPGWFDKHFKNRYANSRQLDSVIMLSPSPRMIGQLAGGKIPDRKDFVTLQDDDPLRQRQWRRCMDLSCALGDEFLATMQHGNIMEKLQPF